VADIPTAGLAQGTTVTFTFLWADGNRWEGTNFAVAVGDGPGC
jgi:hypothetical protein